MNLTELLAALSNLDEAGEVEFDPQQVVGELKDKVDAIHKVLGRLKAEQNRLMEEAEKIAAAGRDMQRQHFRLTEYLAFAMRSQGFDKLPGQMWRVQFQKSAPSVQIDREPAPDDFIANPAFVNRTVRYSWIKDEIKAYIARGNEFPDAKIVQGQYLKFYVNKEGAK